VARAVAVALAAVEALAVPAVAAVASEEALAAVAAASVAEDKIHNKIYFRQ